MKFLRLALLLITALLSVSACAPREEDGHRLITLRALNNWYDDTRMENLILAVREINEELEKEGAKERIHLDVVKLYVSWEEYREYFRKAFSGSESIDIMAIGHSHLPILAGDGYLRELSWVRDSEAYRDVYSSLWPAMEWSGKVWGAPQDMDVTLLFINRKLLASLGYSDREMDALPERVEKGEFTVSHMEDLAAEAVGRGISPVGFLHRPENGQHFYIMGRLERCLFYNRETDGLTVDSRQLKRSLQWFYRNSWETGISPPDGTLWSWEKVDETVMYDRTLFWFGHTNNFFEYMVKGLSYKELQDKFVVTLYPADREGERPVSVSNPTAYVVASNTRHPELIRRLLERVADTRFQARHAVETYHLPIDKKSAGTVEFKSNSLLNDALYMMDYTTFVPATPRYAVFSELYFRAVREIETGEKDVDQALAGLLEELRRNHSASITIR